MIKASISYEEMSLKIGFVIPKLLHVDAAAGNGLAQGGFSFVL